MEADPGDELDVMTVTDGQVHFFAYSAHLGRIYQRIQLGPYIPYQFLVTNSNQPDIS